MKFPISIPDEQYERLEAVAKAQGKFPDRFVSEAIDFILHLNKQENQILLTGREVAAISDTVGGKTLRTGSDIVKLFQDVFRIKVSGIALDLDMEDTNIMHEQYDSFKDFVTFDQFVADSIKDALGLYLWGSTRGVVSYR